MSNTPTIESRNLSISDIFKDFYIVPDFQREYVWQEENVKKLLEDLFDGLGLYESEAYESEYFLGSIVVYPDSKEDKKTFQLIDGQQRLTTIYLIFCSIRNFIKRLNDKSRSLDDLIQGVAQDINTGEDIYKYRLSLQYDSCGKKWMQCILENKDFEKSLLKSSRSAKNLDSAWRFINRFLSENVTYNAKEFKRISTNISNRTKLIRIESQTLRSALKVFETINERGVGLSPVDLLKNYLFIHTYKNQSATRNWDNLTKKWEEFLSILYECDQKPLQFLRYYLMSHYTVDLSNNFPEEGVYDWFLDNEEKHNIKTNTLEFLDELNIAAKHYSAFVKCQNIDGLENQFLKNVSKIQGRITQHFILLLGGKHLQLELFNELCRLVESLIFIYAITRKTRRKDVNITRQFSQWSRKLRLVNDKISFDRFILENIRPEITDLKEDFKQALLQISETNFAKFRLRYLLAKISQYVENKSFNASKPLDIYLDKSITIEHILPQSSNDTNSHRLGNLTLLEKTINSSISDKDYLDKLSGYKESQILLTRSLVSVPKVGNQTTINITMIDLNLKSFDVWDYDSIEQRQALITEIAMEVWNLT